MIGVHIVVTRAAHQAEDLAKPLRELGARVTILPTIGIAPPLDVHPLQQAAAALATFDWLVFTSVNTVRAFSEYAKPAKVPVAVVGPATRDAAQALHFRVELMGDEFVAESLAKAFEAKGVARQRILIPSASAARDVLPRERRKQGAEVTVVEAYRNVCPPEAAAQAATVFMPPLPDWILFASPSAFNNLMPLIEGEALHAIKIGSIGPSTSAAIRREGFDVAAEASPQTVEGLVQAVVTYEQSTREDDHASGRT